MVPTHFFLYPPLSQLFPQLPPAPLVPSSSLRPLQPPLPFHPPLDFSLSLIISELQNDPRSKCRRLICKCLIINPGASSQGTASPLPPSPSPSPSPSHLPSHLSRCPQNRDTRNEKGPNHSRCPQIRDTGNAPDAQPPLPGTFWSLFVPGTPLFRSPGTFDPYFVPGNPIYSLPGSYRSCRQRALRPRAP